MDELVTSAHPIDFWRRMAMGALHASFRRRNARLLARGSPRLVEKSGPFCADGLINAAGVTSDHSPTRCPLDTPPVNCPSTTMGKALTGLTI